MELTQNFTARFQPKRGTLSSDLRLIISKATQRPFPQIAKLTQFWNETQLKEGAFEAEKSAINFWVFRKKMLK